MVSNVKVCSIAVLTSNYYCTVMCLTINRPQKHLYARYNSVAKKCLLKSKCEDSSIVLYHCLGTLVE